MKTSDVTDQLSQLITRNPKIALSVGALLIAALLGLILRSLLNKRMHSRMDRLRPSKHFEAVLTHAPFAQTVEETRQRVQQSMRSRYSVMNRIAMGIVFSLGVLGAAFPFLSLMPKAVVSLLIAIAAAVLGIAAKPFVENLISGVVISFASHFRIGDTIILDGEHYGTVEDITMTHTVVKLWDWSRRIVPNSVMIQKDYTNLSHKDAYLWAYIEFQVDYDVDLELVENIAKEGAKASKFLAAYEEPQLWLRDMHAGSVRLWLSAWASSAEEAWYLRSDMRRAIVEGLRRHGLRSHLHHVDLGGVKGQPVAGKAEPLAASA